MSRTAFWAVVVASISMSSAAVVPAAAGPRAPAAPPAAVAGDQAAPAPVEVPDAAADEVIVTARADSGGYHLQVAESTNDWAWRPLATILPEGADGEPWTGYHCLTGDGRFVVAVVAPWGMSNDPAGRDRGGLLYRVALPHGEVTPIAANAATKYYNPGCGADDRVAVISHEGIDQQATTVRLYDVGDLALVHQWDAQGQLTSAVPLNREGPAVAAARDAALVELDGGGEEVVAEPGGLPFQVRANRGGGVEFLVTDRRSDDVAIWSAAPAAGGAGPAGPGGGALAAREVGAGALGDTKLFAGRERTTAVNATEVAGGAGLHRTVAEGGRPVASSSHGAVVAVDLRDDERREGERGADEPGADGGRAPAASGADGGHDHEVTVQDVSRRTLQRSRDGADLRRPEPRPVEGAATAALPPGLGVAGGGGARGALTHADPKCAVPRNDVLRQAHQPSSRQVNWAIQQATRNNLRGSVLTRPAYYRMWWLPAYEPSVQFPRDALRGASGASVPVPPSVAQAVFAQESNWKQATWRALPNVGGNPLVGDYYGAGGTLGTIDYGQADCGYGISQVTTPMTRASTVYTDLQKAIAGVDYAANVAAGIGFLTRHWNEAHAAGVIANNGDPSRLENWYFALWAYNSGFYPRGGSHPGTPHGAWGLGWTNNPIQADYPPDRSGFLRTTYADAEHPNDWPYQERIFGWMETPQLNYRGEEQYARPTTPDGTGWLHLPDRTRFCNSTNSCDPAHEVGSRSYCRLREPDPYCWWHEPATWVDTGLLSTSRFTVDAGATEPSIASGSDDDNYPPNCNRLPPLSRDGRPHVIVDNTHPNLNIQGCSPSGWSSQGTFTVAHGTDAHGAPLGEIDWHQLGTGFSGHTWFTKNRLPGDASHTNTGTWTPPSLTGRYNVKAHVPPSGASTSSAHYVVHNGAGRTTDVYVDQHLHENRWVSLGTFDLNPGAKVVLTNVTSDPVPGTANVAFDAMAFTPVPSTGRIVDVTVDAALIFGPDQPTTVDSGTSFITNNPMRDDGELREWMVDHLDPLVSLPDCPTGTRRSSCLPPTLKLITTVVRNEVTAHPNPARWQAFNNDRPPRTLPAGYFDDSNNHKHHNRVRVTYTVSDTGQIDPASVTMNFTSQAGMTHVTPVMMHLFQYVQFEYGVRPPDLRYSAENMGTYSHSSSPVDPLATGGDMPGRAFAPYATPPDVVNNCVRVHAVGGSVIGWKPALNEGGIAGEFRRWKDDIKELRDDGIAPGALYELADGFYHYWWSNQYGIYGYEGSPFRQSPPIWIEMGVDVCGQTGSVNGVADFPIGMNSQMPDLYLWRNGAQIDQTGLPSGEPALRGDFRRFSRTQTSDQHPWGGCSYTAFDDYADRRSGNPWAIDMLVDGKDLGNDVSFCRNDVPDPSGPPDHG